MFCIAKKAVIGVAAAALLSTLVFGRDAISYVKTFGSSARQAIKAEVPIEFEIQRARDMVANLLPDIRECMHVIAEEEVNVEHLSKEIARAENDLGKQKDEILALRRHIDSGRQVYQTSTRAFSCNEVKRDLSSRFDRYKTAETTVASKRQILHAREQSVSAAREKLEGMLNEKRNLEVQLENLDARLKTVQAAQTASNVQLDVAQKMLDADGKFTGLIPVETASQVPEDLSSQIDEYFGRDTKPTPTTTDKTVAERGAL